MKVKILATLIAAGITAAVFSQNETDVLRYSRFNYGGTARFMSVSGAFGALGGDFSTLSTNPAGIAIYRKNEFMFTPSLFKSGASSLYYGDRLSDDKYGPNISNAGFVLTFDQGGNSEGGWVSTNFGFGYNRLNNFHQKINILGVNPSTSLLDDFVQQANGIDATLFDQENPPLPFTSALAWQTFLIDKIPGTDDQYYPWILAGGVEQNQVIKSKGGMGEVVLSFGGNFANRLYTGVTLGLPNIRFERNTVHTETDIADTIPQFQSFTFREDLITRGNGVNAKFGMIFRINDYVRIGGAVHTPTFFSVSEEFDTELTRIDDDGTITTVQPARAGAIDYNVTSPFRALGSIGVTVGKSGFISAEYEFADYSNASLEFDDFNDSKVNRDIESNLAATNNFGIGGEWRYGPFTFRGGAKYQGNPYDEQVLANGERKSFSLGFGYREEFYFLDFGYMNTRYKENIFPYSPALVEPASVKVSDHNFLITMGLRY